MTHVMIMLFVTVIATMSLHEPACKIKSVIELFLSMFIKIYTFKVQDVLANIVWIKTNPDSIYGYTHTVVPV